MSRPARPPALPTRHGVSPSCVAARAGDGPTVLDMLAQRLPALARHEWAQRLHAGDVLGESGQPLAADAACRPGLRAFYYRHWDDEPHWPAADAERIVFQDEWLVVADKPHFMPVTPSGRFVRRSLLVRLKDRLGLPALSPVHRIDRETAGLVVLAVQPHTRNAYQALFRQRQVHKVYEAVAPRLPALRLPHTHASRLAADGDPARFFLSREVPGPANSHTTIHSAQPLPGAHATGGAAHAGDGDAGGAAAPLALYRLHPATGQRHQLRLHMCALGAPILGDAFYPRVLRAAHEGDDTARPLQLLARALAFDDPVTGLPRRFASTRQLAAACGQWPATAAPQTS